MTKDKIYQEFQKLGLTGIELFEMPRHMLGQTICFARTEPNGKKIMVSDFYSYDEMAAYIEGIKFIQQNSKRI